jgi:hypothetical protein
VVLVEKGVSSPAELFSNSWLLPLALPATGEDPQSSSVRLEPSACLSMPMQGASIVGSSSGF